MKIFASMQRLTKNMIINFQVCHIYGGLAYISLAEMLPSGQNIS